MIDRPPTPVSREDLVQEIALGLRFDARKRMHNSEDIMARIAAEKLADHLGRSNFVVVHGPGTPGQGGSVDGTNVGRV